MLQLSVTLAISEGFSKKCVTVVVCSLLQGGHSLAFIKAIIGFLYHSRDRSSGLFITQACHVTK